MAKRHSIHNDAMTGSYTATAMPGLPNTFIPRILELRASWPDPENSIDIDGPVSIVPTSSIMGKLIDYYWWSVQGPALDAYRSIEVKIRDCLESRDDLFEGENESALPSSVGCYMVGRKPAKARPCIMISCQSKIYCRKAIKILKENDWWIKFNRQYPGFSFVHMRNAPRPIRLGNGSPNGVLDTKLVYTSEHSSSAYGAPLISARQENRKDGMFASAEATLGGLVYLDGVPYGLTVAHSLLLETAGDSVGDGSSTDDHQEEVFSFMDDSDDEQTQSWDTNDLSEDDWVPPTQSRPLYGNDRATQSQHPTEVSGESLVALGRIQYSSSGLSDDNLDWALLSLKYMPPLPRTSCSKEKVENSLDRTNGNVMSIRDITSIAGPLESSRPVFTTGWDGRLIKGHINASPTLIRLGGSRRYLSLYSVTLDQGLHLGDSGKWIFDSAGNWYGHVVAGSPGSRLAYVVPGYQIKEDIEKVTSKRMTLHALSLPASRFIALPVDVQPEIRNIERQTSNQMTPHATLLPAPRLISRPVYHPEITDFIKWVEAESIGGVNDPFMPLSKLERYLKEGNRTERLLRALFVTDKPPIKPEEVWRNCMSVFSILLLIGRGTFILYFVQQDQLWDVKLPFSSRPSRFPLAADDYGFFESFFQKQWRFSAHTFRQHVFKAQLEKERVLPIVDKQLLGDGSSALTYKIKLHPDYDKLRVPGDIRRV